VAGKGLLQFPEFSAHLLIPLPQLAHQDLKRLLTGLLLVNQKLPLLFAHGLPNLLILNPKPLDLSPGTFEFLLECEDGLHHLAAPGLAGEAGGVCLGQVD
jgi:hypothetical protein